MDIKTLEQSPDKLLQKRKQIEQNALLQSKSRAIAGKIPTVLYDVLLEPMLELSS